MGIQTPSRHHWYCAWPQGREGPLSLSPHQPRARGGGGGQSYQGTGASAPSPLGAEGRSGMRGQDERTGRKDRPPKASLLSRLN